MGRIEADSLELWRETNVLSLLCRTFSRFRRSDPGAFVCFACKGSGLGSAGTSNITACGDYRRTAWLTTHSNSSDVDRRAGQQSIKRSGVRPARFSALAFGRLGRTTGAHETPSSNRFTQLKHSLKGPQAGGKPILAPHGAPFR